MSTTLLNNAEGGTNGTTVTIANSGGSSGTAWTNVAINTGEALTYDNTHAAHGTLAYKFVCDGSHAVNFYWDQTWSGTQVWFRIYLFVVTAPTANNDVLRVFTSGGTTTCAELRILAAVSGNSKMTLAGTSGAGVQTTTATIPLSQWFRVEGYVTGSATAGQVELKLFTGLDNVTPAETHTSASNINTGGTPVRMSYGVPTQGSGGITAWLDDIGASDAGYIGPVNPSATGTVSAAAGIAAPAAVQQQEAGTTAAAAASVASAVTQRPSGASVTAAASAGSTEPAQTFQNTCEGLPSGTAVTTANSGGPSGDAFTTVFTGANTTCASDSTHAAHGSQSFQFVSGPNNNQTDVQWAFTDGSVQQWFRIYLYLPANPPTAAIAIAKLVTAGAVRCMQANINTSGKVILTDSANATQATSANAVPLNQWCRIEGYCTGNGGTAGAVELKLFQGADDLTTTDVHTATGLNTGGVPVTWLLGIPIPGSQNITLWLDDLGVSSAGYLGPLSLVPDVTEAPAGTVAAAASVTGPDVTQAVASQPVSAAAAIAGPDVTQIQAAVTSVPAAAGVTSAVTEQPSGATAGAAGSLSAPAVTEQPAVVTAAAAASLSAPDVTQAGTAAVAADAAVAAPDVTQAETSVTSVSAAAAVTALAVQAETAVTTADAAATVSAPDATEAQAGVTVAAAASATAPDATQAVTAQPVPAAASIAAPDVTQAETASTGVAAAAAVTSPGSGQLPGAAVAAAGSVSGLAAQQSGASAAASASAAAVVTEQPASGTAAAAASVSPAVTEPAGATAAAASSASSPDVVQAAGAAAVAAASAGAPLVTEAAGTTAAAAAGISASGSQLITGSATLPMSLTTSPAGSKGAAGTAAGTVSFADSAAGAKRGAGASARTVSFASTAAGAKAASGTVTGVISLAGLAAGSKRTTGLATATIAFASSLTGARPLGVLTGTAAAEAGPGGSAAASSGPGGTAAGVLAVTGAASVVPGPQGTASAAATPQGGASVA